MSKTENDSDTKLFRFNKKMFLKLVPDEEQDKSYAYGKVVTQIYIEEKDGAELKKLKDEKQVSDLKQELSIDNSQNREAIEKRTRDREREREKKESKINNNEVVISLTEYNTIFKKINMQKLNNYMMYLDKEISIEVIDDKIVVKYRDKKVVEDDVDKIDDVNKKKYIKKIIKKIYSDEFKDIISKRSDIIENKLSKIKDWKDKNNIISNIFIDNQIEAKERLDHAKNEMSAAKAEAKADAEAEVNTASASLEAANKELNQYLENANKSAPFDGVKDNIKDYLMDNDELGKRELIGYAGLNDESYKAIQSINTLDENVDKFNKIFNIYIDIN